jgi:hypothetical protein
MKIIGAGTPFRVMSGLKPSASPSTLTGKDAYG